VYYEVRKKLFLNIVEMLLQEEIPLFAKQGLSEQMTCYLEHAWDMAQKGTPSQINLGITTPSVLVGVGAPIHVFLPEVARVLGTDCVIPPHSEVVNAVGAVACNVTVSRTVRISTDGVSFLVPTDQGIQSFKDYAPALQVAEKEAEKLAREAALERGADSELLIRLSTRDSQAKSSFGSSVFLSSEVTATAIGAISFAE